MLVILYASMYVVIPAILLGTIGGWTFLVYAVWLFGSYEVVKKSCEEREHMPMMEHTDAMGVMMFISVPTVLSALVFFIIYVLLNIL
jgi:1,4-dihydroxy-2-naphthoate octaprenyltransferase|tara:strand:- start:773 stop:1033 length:261 start_codon:yes stop_codon:yes gene_type:complete